MTATQTQEQILDAVLSVVVRNGVQGLTFRAVAAEADVALGSLNYHFDDKEALIAAAFRRAAENVIDATEGSVAHIEDSDEAVRVFIRGVLTEEFLNEDYLALRLSLWAVGRFAPDIAAINARIHARYRDELCRLITRARPALTRDQAFNRVTDLMMVQFGLWVTWTWQPDQCALERCLTRCEQIALGERESFE